MWMWGQKSQNIGSIKRLKQCIASTSTWIDYWILNIDPTHKVPANNFADVLINQHTIYIAPFYRYSQSRVHSVFTLHMPMLPLPTNVILKKLPHPRHVTITLSNGHLYCSFSFLFLFIYFVFILFIVLKYMLCFCRLN